MIKKSLVLLTLLIGLGALSACAPTVTISRLKPAKITEATRLRRITVLDFTGKGGPKLAEELGGILKEIHVEHKPYFNIKQQESFYESVISKREGSNRSAHLKTEKMSLERATKTEGLLTGNILKRSCSARFFTKKAEKCVKYKEGRKRKSFYC